MRKREKIGNDDMLHKWNKNRVEDMTLIKITHFFIKWAAKAPPVAMMLLRVIFAPKDPPTRFTDTFTLGDFKNKWYLNIYIKSKKYSAKEKETHQKWKCKWCKMQKIV